MNTVSYTHLRVPGAHVAREGEAHSGTRGDAVHGGDGRLGDARDAHRLAPDPAELVDPDGVTGLGPLGRPLAGQVGARAEAPPGPRDHQHPDVVVLVDLLAQGEQLLGQFHAERVELVRSVECRDGHVAVALEAEVRLGHDRSPRRFSSGARSPWP